MQSVFRLIAVFSLLVPQALAQQGEATGPAAGHAAALEARLDRLVEALERERKEHHIPGMALAVVHQGELVLEHGFGLADLEAGRPVTGDTLFPVGSATKAFTAAAVGVLVDEGKLDLDAPVSDYLEFFDLPIDAAEGEFLTLRDLLSHRSGFTRMQILAAGNHLGPETILRAAKNAEPWAGFRERLLYSNVGYLAAGVSAGRVAGSDWHALVEQRLLAPLGMTDSVTSVARIPGSASVSKGYIWSEDEAQHRAVQPRVIDNIAPAGAVISTAGDMARWLQFQLGRGVFEEERLLSEEQHAEAWTAQIEASPSVGYGFGWMVREHGGEKLVEHGGNVRGFCSQVGLFPESDLGYALLMNVSVSVLQQQSVALVHEILLEEPRAPGAGLSEQDLEPYLGTYIGDFGPFQEAPFEVRLENGRLAVDVPGQQLFELKEPDEEGRWYFALTNAVAVSFDRDEQQRVVGMRFHQAGLAFELPREGVVIEPEIPLAELARYLGAYDCEEPPITATVLVKNNRLAIDWPREMVYELHPPDEEGVWLFRVTDRFRLRFVEDDQGRVTGFHYTQAEIKLDFERVAAASDEEVPTLAQIDAQRDTAGRKAALAALGAVRMEGAIRFPQCGIEGKAVFQFDGLDRLLTVGDLGRFGWLRVALSGERGWMDASFVAFEELDAAGIERIRGEHPYIWIGDWRGWFDEVTVLKNGLLDERPTWVLKMQRGEGDPHTVQVDRETGDVLQVEVVQTITGAGGSLPVLTRYEDYRDVAGVRFPFRITSRNEMTGRTVQQFERAEVAAEAAPGTFELEPSPRPEPWTAPRPSGRKPD